MAIKKNGAKEYTLNSIDCYSNKSDVRKFILSQYINEDCGVKLRYYVETLANGKRIYLERPTFLNKGCDFQIFVEDLIIFKNGNDKCPSHKDLINDLILKKSILNKKQFSNLISAVEKIYNVKPYCEAEIIIKALPCVTGWSYETILKLVRWFFIEQDITYWAQTGRYMLMNEINKL